MTQYDHRAIEKKWQKHWEETRAFKAEHDPSRPKYYVLDMFPYPSGAGLHVGHVAGYTATDIIARHKRQLGFNVLHPMGWDSFGLPAEQYAIRTGTHPAETTTANIDNFRRQLKYLGFSYDWDREFMTSDAKHYKWTQWIFTELYKKGLAYESNALVNFCPALGTVLANEEVEEGVSVEGGHPVERRPLRQWMLKITAYAERLLKDLDLVDWPEGLKKLQRNWIGRSEGAKIHFSVKGIEEKISVFTTRHDTLFGATYMVLSPEHPLVDRLTTPAQSAAVESYQQEAAAKSDLARTDLAKHKSGVFTGTYAINPATGEEVPVWIGDYVLMGYGTGAIMCVPGHDERDFEFAEKYDLPVTSVFDPDVEGHRKHIPEGMSAEQVREEVLEGKRVWPFGGKCINSKNSEISLNDLSVPEAKKTMAEWLEKKKLGEETINYKLRDWLFSRQRYWGEPFPILHQEDGSTRLLDTDELPLCPPELTDYRPSEDGQSPLARVKEWVEITDPKTGKPVKRETNTMPQWAGSCWYYLRFADPHNDERAWDPEKEKYWQSVDMYIGGAEHAVLHLLYARFWHKVLYDLGHVSYPEPFQTLRNPGMINSRSYKLPSGKYIEETEVEEDNGHYTHRESGEKLRSQVEKMSKSKLNGVSPDEIVDEFGADSLRLYEMFMGPLDKEKVWNTDAVSGCSRFLRRFFDLVNSDKVSEETTEEALKLGHRLIHGVKKDIEGLLFNTAIAKMMEFINALLPLEKYPKEVLLMATQALMPFAPHIAEEAWEILGGDGELITKPFPEVDMRYLEDATITYVVQVNGKLRGKIDLPKDQSQEVIVDLAKGDPGVSKYINGSEIARVIFVPNKLLNFVVKK